MWNEFDRTPARTAGRGDDARPGFFECTQQTWPVSAEFGRGVEVKLATPEQPLKKERAGLSPRAV